MALVVIVILFVSGYLASVYITHQNGLFPNVDLVKESAAEPRYLTDIINSSQSDRDVWGQTGDFFGGMLNPIISLGALILLAWNLFLTKTELEETRNILGIQIKSQQKQGFEDTFFSLLGQHNALLNVVKKRKYKFKWEEVDSLEKAREELLKDMDKSNYELKIYFNFLYQLLKFIDSSEVEDKKTYSNLVRSFIDSDTGELILINALCFNDSNDFKEFKVFIEKYAFLEHVQIDTQLGKINNAIRVLNGDAMPTAWASNIPGVRSGIEQDNRREPTDDSDLIKKDLIFIPKLREMIGVINITKRPHTVIVIIIIVFDGLLSRSISAER